MPADPSLPSIRRILRANVVFTGLSALLLIALPSTIDEVLGTGRPGWIRLVGIGLALFAVDVALLSRSSEQRLVSGTLLIAAADLGWVLGTIAVVVAGWFEPAGSVLALLVAAMVGTFGVLEFSGVRRARRPAVAAQELTLGT